MALGQIIGPRLGKQHGPGQIGAGHASPQLAIDEVADTPGGQTQRHQRGDEVGQLPEAALLLAGKQGHAHQHTEETTVEGHATLPHHEDFCRMAEVVARFVKQHLTQTSANHHAEHAVHQQVVQQFGSEEGMALADAVIAQKQEQAKAQ